MTGFDYAAIAVLVVSGLIGLVRGATREISTVVAFLVAAILAVFTVRFSGPLAHRLIHTVWLANTSAILLVFIITYIVLRLIGGVVTRGVQEAGLSGLDRGLGFGIGLVRALVVLGGFALLVNAATPPERMPLWISDAKLYPLASAAGNVLRTFSPKGMKVAHDVAPALADAVTGETVTGETVRGDATPADATPDPAIAAPRHRHPTSGYPYEQRRALDDIVEQSR